jgi:hypothetical protein
MVSSGALTGGKTFLKSTMSQARLNSVLLLHVRKELSPDIKSVMAEFIGLNDTRRPIFGDIRGVHQAYSIWETGTNVLILVPDSIC